MSDPTMHADPLLCLAEAICDEVASENDFVQLDAIMLADTDARRRYLDYCQLHFALRLELRAEWATQSTSRHIDIESVVLASDKSSAPRMKTSPPIPFGFLSTTLPGTVGWFSSDWPVAYLVATVIFGIGLLIGSVVQVSEPAQIAQRSLVPVGAVGEPKIESVGRITGMVDCKWVQSPKSRVQSPTLNPRLSTIVSLGDTFALASGLMEITYDTGAKVILQGPVTYEVESNNGGFMSIGKLTGKVVTANAKGFSVRTPTTTVTDLGTEFGIEVNQQGQTTSHVFRGSVRLQVASVDGKAEGVFQVLHENQSACVERSSGKQGGGNRLTVLGPFAKPTNFVRELSKRTIKMLDLVDVVAGGNGLGRARDCGIDPTTGRTSAKQPDNLDLWSDGRYHKVPERPFVDGVFIPYPAKGPVQLDSAGHAFAGFPNTTGESWGYIWAGGPWLDRAGKPPLSARLMRGLDYSAPWHSVLGMHANKGITFDLGAIRQANPRCKLIRFAAVAGRAVYGEDPGKSDVWVFIDGQSRFQRERITQEDGELQIAVALDDQSRFLTLVATDSGDRICADVVIFGDPKLVLAEYSEVAQ